MKGLKKQLRGVDELFDTEEIFNASEEELMGALEELSTRNVPNPDVRHREIVRGMTINAILGQRHIDRIERRNTQLTWLFIALTSISITLSILSFAYSYIFELINFFA